MSKIAETTFTLMIVTMVAKLLGFGRELVLASAYGASMYSDAYLTAMNIPYVIFTIMGGTLGTIFIPMYFEIKNKEGEKEALKFTNNISNIVIVMGVLLVIFGFIFTEEIVKLFAIGFKGEILDISIKFTRIIMIGTIFTGISYIGSAYLQIKNNFIIPGAITIPRNIIIIISIILSMEYGPYIMIWGTLIGIASEVLLQLPFLINNGYRYIKYINMKDKYIKRTIKLIAPVFIGVAVNQINTMVDRTLASTLSEGSISALNYANKLNGFVMGLFITSIITVIYPMLSRLSFEDDREQFKKSLVASINSVTLLIIPISMGAIILAKPIVKVLFERGEFDSRATSMTAVALIMYSIGMVAFGLRDVLNKVFYSLQDTKTPMVNGVIAMSINIILNIVFIKYLGLVGLALSTSISSIICIFLLFVSLNKKIAYFGQDKIIKTTFKSIISAIVMGVGTYFIYKFLYNILGSGFVHEVISLFGAICTGALIYGIFIVVLKVEEVGLIVDIINRKLTKSKYKENIK